MLGMFSVYGKMCLKWRQDIFFLLVGPCQPLTRVLISIICIVLDVVVSQIARFHGSQISWAGLGPGLAGLWARPELGCGLGPFNVSLS